MLGTKLIVKKGKYDIRLLHVRCVILYLSVLVMWWSWSKFTFVECEFWLSNFVKCKCK